jgi:hypothetical protein
MTGRIAREGGQELGPSRTRGRLAQCSDRGRSSHRMSSHDPLRNPIGTLKIHSKSTLGVRCGKGDPISSDLDPSRSLARMQWVRGLAGGV